MYGKLPSPITVTTLEQNKTTGALSVIYHYQIPTTAIHGLWIPCGASLSPWNTHLSSEEYEPDAWLVQMRKTKGSALTSAELTGWYSKQIEKANSDADQFFEFSRNTLDTSTTTDANTTGKPYHYGHVPEVTVNPDGTGTIKKHYAMGRFARELAEVMPDNKTVLMGDDYVGGALYMFIANTPGDLSSGTLYAAKFSQASNVTTNGGRFTLTWIKLGSATSAEIETAANTLSANQIIDVVFADPSDVNYTSMYLDGGGRQWVKVLAGKSKEAAFLETHRYAAVSGATMELTKLEGVTLNKEDKVGYFAISRIEAPMSIHTTTTTTSGGTTTTTNAVNGTTSDILLTASRPGAVYASHLAGNINDTSGTAINSSWVPTDFYVPDGLYGEALSSADNDGNLANVNKISQPDNVKFSEAMRTLFISEDGTGHLNNYMWAYNVDTNVLSKVLATPAGAESTGLQAVDNLNGFAYIMTGFQHAGGELSYNSGTGTGTSNGKTVPADVMSAIISNWGGINKKSPVGYIAGLPTLGS
jgi:hypothetical protein